MSKHSYVHAIRITWIDKNRADLLAVTEAEMCPRLAAVCGFLNSISGGKIRPPQSLSAADINDVRVRWSKRQRSDRASRLTIEDRSPCTSEIVGLPHPAVIWSHKKDVRLIRNSGDCYGAACAERTNAAPAQFFIGNGAILGIDHRNGAQNDGRNPSVYWHESLSFKKLPRINVCGLQRKGPHADRCICKAQRVPSRRTQQGSTELRTKSPVKWPLLYLKFVLSKISQ